MQCPKCHATLENEGAALDDGLWTRSRDFDWGD